MFDPSANALEVGKGDWRSVSIDLTRARAKSILHGNRRNAESRGEEVSKDLKGLLIISEYTGRCRLLGV